MDKCSDCPYGANDCPKVNDLCKALEKVNNNLSILTKLVYIMAGMMFCEMGVTLW